MTCSAAIAVIGLSRACKATHTTEIRRPVPSWKCNPNGLQYVHAAAAAVQALPRVPRACPASPGPRH
eukprot:3843526-Lingulodinium_polyedra.AAC.1